MHQIPLYLDLLFLFISVIAVLFFYKAAQSSKKILLLFIVYGLLQSLLAYTGFYTNTTSIPPRFSLVLLPALILILYTFFSKKGRKFIDQLDIRYLTLLHSIRIVMEIILFLLFTYAVIPELMTFSGRNFDIIPGLTAPFVFYFAFVQNKIKKKGLLLWNFIGLFLILFIAFNGLLSAPLPIQQFGFDQPNIALMYFPYTLLPAIVVPLVIFSHLASIRQLLTDQYLNYKS